MVIFDRNNLKVFCHHVSSILASLTGQNISQSHIRELSARLTNRNSYSHLCSDLKLAPVEACWDVEECHQFISLLYTKHKHDLNDDDVFTINRFLKSQPINLIPAPKTLINPSTHQPVLDWDLEQHVEVSQRYLSKNTPPLSDEEMDEARRLVTDDWLDGGIDHPDVMNEFLMELFAEQVTIDEDCDQEKWDNEWKSWKHENQKLIKRLKTYADHASFSKLEALSSGANLWFSAFSFADIDSSGQLARRFSPSAYIGFWKITAIDIQFAYDEFMSTANMGNIACLMGVYDKGEWTPIGSAACHSVDPTDMSEDYFFDVCDAHSAMMNDSCKEALSWIGDNYGNLPTYRFENCFQSTISRLTNMETYIDVPEIKLMLARCLCDETQMSGIQKEDDEFDVDVASNYELPFYTGTRLLMCEVCGPAQTDEQRTFGFPHFPNPHSTERIAEAVRAPLTKDQHESLQSQKHEFEMLKLALRNELDVISYDPWSYPMT